MNFSCLSQLEKKIASFSLADYPRNSRIHRLKSFDTPLAKVFIKREDELGFISSGSKTRKYLSLIPYLLTSDFDEILVLGSSYSNHLLSLSYLLREHGVIPTLFLQGKPPRKIKGNYLFLRFITHDRQLHWVAEGEVIDVAEKYLKARTKQGLKLCLIPFGADCIQALPGALTLPLDLMRNEQESGLCFDHIFIDSGTGLMAKALILGLSYLEHPATVHVIQVYPKSKKDFLLELAQYQKEFEFWVERAFSQTPPFLLYHPQEAPSYGGFNAKHRKLLRLMANQEGILLDPIYNAKLFLEGERIIKEKELKGNILFIHSGGNLSLSGFEELLLSI